MSVDAGPRRAHRRRRVDRRRRRLLRTCESASSATAIRCRPARSSFAPPFPPPRCRRICRSPTRHSGPGPSWHMIYYPISDWTMFNLGCTVVTGEAKLGEAEEFAPDAVLPIFSSTAAKFRIACFASRKASATTSSCTASRSRTGPWVRRRCWATPRIRWCSTSPRARRWRWRMRSASPARRTNATAISRSAFQRYQDIRIVRTARVQISSMMLSRLNHAKGVERKVRNSLFEGRTPEQYLRPAGVALHPAPLCEIAPQFGDAKALAPVNVRRCASWRPCFRRRRILAALRRLARGGRVLSRSGVLLGLRPLRPRRLSHRAATGCTAGRPR